MKLSNLLLSTALLAVTALPVLAQEITVWDWKSGDPAAAPYFQKAKEIFEAAHPGVTVNFVMQPNDQYYTLLGTALSSEGGPDLFLLNGGAQARARFGDALKLDDKIGDLKGQLAGLPEFFSTVAHASSFDGSPSGWPRWAQFVYGPLPPLATMVTQPSDWFAAIGNVPV